MSVTKLCVAYLDALNAGDPTRVLELFVPDAQVRSPLYGERSVAEFYAELFGDTERSETSLLNIFESADASAAIALHFRYVWTLSDDQQVSFDCVDVFTLNDDRTQFATLTIIYDTAPLRARFDTMRRGQARA